jgi:hypothetical protein
MLMVAWLLQVRASWCCSEAVAAVILVQVSIIALGYSLNGDLHALLFLAWALVLGSVDSVETFTLYEYLPCTLGDQGVRYLYTRGLLDCKTISFAVSTNFLIKHWYHWCL